MAIKHYKPTTNGRRGMTTLANEELTTSKPTKSLVKSIARTGGRNNQGKMTVRHIGGGAHKKYRVIDFKRNKIPFIVLAANFFSISAAENLCNRTAESWSDSYSPSTGIMYLSVCRRYFS